MPTKGTMKPLGTVYLVGAGPGNPDLITVRGLTCLREADVVLHDRLIDLHLLEEAKPGAEIISVGKEPGEENLQQEHIQWLMIEKAREGKDVCRLKGGDPFVFGRGGEEALALSEAGIAFEIVPGVSSAIAVPAYAGIPVTHRGVASSFAVLTGHEDPSKDGAAVDWRALATAVDTLVVLMGVSSFPRTVGALLANGRSPETPVALIRWGTTDAQEVRVGTLADIVERARGLEPPVVAVIG